MAKGQAIKHPIAPRLRGAFLDALDIKGKREGKSLAEIVDALIEKEGLLAVMDRVSKFQERTSTVDMNHTGDLGLVDVLSALSGRVSDTEVESESGSVRH